METKELANALRSFYAIFSSKERISQILDFTPLELAADRLEELEEINEKWCDIEERNKERFSKLHEEIADLEKQLSESQPQWISVEDRLPEENGTYLIAVKGSYASHFTGFDIESNEFCDNVFRKSDVTHWMPLPEPPKPKVPTFKDKFLEAFPKATILDSAVNIDCCAVFPWLLDEEGCCQKMDMTCEECWNQPYFEEEGEGNE